MIFENFLEMNDWMKTHGSGQCPTYSTSDPATLKHNVKDVFNVGSEPQDVGVEECQECPKLQRSNDELSNELQELRYVKGAYAYIVKYMF